MQLTRRDMFRFSAASALGAAVLVNVPAAQAQSFGTLVDYAGGVPDADAIAAAGHIGVIRYVSDRRKGAEWMTGKPLLASEAKALASSSLSIVSCYQFGKGPTADWRGGLAAGRQHATRGLELHKAAGGPSNRPIYASIDDNPSATEFATLIAPYLIGWESVLGKGNVGVYANSPTIDLAKAAGLGSFYWQHNWGTPKGFVNPSAHLHQFAINTGKIDGVPVDLNRALKADYGQWTR